MSHSPIDLSSLWFGCIERINGCTSQNEVIPIISEFIEAYGFNYFSLGHLVNTSKWGHRRLQCHNWPMEYYQQRIADGTTMKDPTVARALETRLSFTWAAARANADKLGRDIIDQCGDWTAPNGRLFSYFPIGSVPGWCSVGTENDLSEYSAIDSATLHAFGLHCFAVLTRIEGPFPFDAQQTARLSEKQRLVLNYLAAGKSLGDTGTILGISEETTKTHLKRAAHSHLVPSVGDMPNARARAILLRINGARYGRGYYQGKLSIVRRGRRH